MMDSISRLAQPALGLPRVAKRAVALAVDTALCALTVWLALALRMGEWVALSEGATWALLASLALALPVFVVSGLYRAIFRYSGWPALTAVARAMAIYALLYGALVTVVGLPGVPRTVGLIQPPLLLIFVAASRICVRFWLGGIYQSQLQRLAQPQVLVYGAGVAGRQLAAALANGREMRVVGFLDDDDRLHGQVLNGWPIFAPSDLSTVVAEHNVSEVLLALPSVTRQRRFEILAQLAPHHVVVRTLPGLSDLAAGRVTVADLHELDIDDLLGRELVQPNGLLLNRNVRGKTVLVTGAGGSIGSELCRQILACKPARLLLVDMSEFALYQIHQELAGGAADTNSAPEVVPLLGSVCDAARMQEVMHMWHPHTVYHAAAYKHVPLVEHNPAEGIRNNVWGTWVCARAAAENKVQNFVLISTDKAVRPTNIMGASKRLAEMVLQALADSQLQGSTVFSMVRFGNVLGSSGSVVPLFRQQIRSGGPLTITHADITRYFMTIPEAAQLVVQAGAMANGGDVFVLDMGEPVRIVDLAHRMVELSGLSVRNECNPTGDIEIQITGLRPGEKLYEELLIGDNPLPTKHPLIMKAHDDFLGLAALNEGLQRLKFALEANNVCAIRGVLQELVGGYQPDSEIVDWVHLQKQANENRATAV